jgi:hypothetical protein
MFCEYEPSTVIPITAIYPIATYLGGAPLALH